MTTKVESVRPYPFPHPGKSLKRRRPRTRKNATGALEKAPAAANPNDLHPPNRANLAAAAAMVVEAEDPENTTTTIASTGMTVTSGPMNTGSSVPNAPEHTKMADWRDQRVAKRCHGTIAAVTVEVVGEVPRMVVMLPRAVDAAVVQRRQASPRGQATNRGEIEVVIRVRLTVIAAGVVGTDGLPLPLLNGQNLLCSHRLADVDPRMVAVETKTNAVRAVESSTNAAARKAKGISTKRTMKEQSTGTGETDDIEMMKLQHLRAQTEETAPLAPLPMGQWNEATPDLATADENLV